jgi:hypothetical protein
MNRHASIRVLSTNIHGAIDYLYGLGLIVFPWAGGFADLPIARDLLIVAGGFTMGYSMLTRYEWGMAKVVPMKTHLLLDFLVGVLLIAAPYVGGFSKRVWVPFVVFGAFAIVASLITKKMPFGGNWRQLQKELERTPVR